MDKISTGETHVRPALSIIGPRIKGIRLSADDKIKQAIRELKTSDQAEFDTFEEANDFDVEDDTPDPTSGFEVQEMEPDLEFGPKDEIKEEEEKSAPEEALEKGADENPPS